MTPKKKEVISKKKTEEKRSGPKEKKGELGEKKNLIFQILSNIWPQGLARGLCWPETCVPKGKRVTPKKTVTSKKKNERQKGDLKKRMIPKKKESDLSNSFKYLAPGSG